MHQSETGTGERRINVLVCLSASPSNQKVIRSAARFARGNNTAFTALFVDNGKKESKDSYLQSNMNLAKSLGAGVEVVIHHDVLGAVMEYAMEMAVTDLFIGYSGPSRGALWHHLPAYRLVHQLPDVDVHIIPDAAVNLRPSGLDTRENGRLHVKDFLKMAAVMAVATGLSVLIDRSRYSNSNIITIYILAVLVTSVVTAERLYGIFAAILYILLFNFLFIDPRFSFLVYDTDYMVTYLVSLIAAVITGNVSSRMKHSMQQAKTNAWQAQILLNTSELLQRAGDSKEIADITTAQLRQLLDRDIVFYTDREIESEDIPEAEVIRWTYDHNRRAGWNTRYFPDAGYQYLAVRTGNGRYGVIGVQAGRARLDRFEENMLLSLISECALSLEGEKNRQEREEAVIVAENERFRSKLLRSVSHDLRTPLTSISGNAANLMAHEGDLGETERQYIYSDIYEDSIWLIDLVENLLSITRLEESVRLHLTGEVVSDVLDEAVSHIQRHKLGHRIVLETDQECLVARMDGKLILQVLNNLIGNAVKHTPADSVITIRDWKEGDRILVSVSDTGPGIPDAEKEKVFDLFYTGGKGQADGSRSLGLGLNLCRSIVEAHGQRIWLTDNRPTGAVFTFSLMQWEGKDLETISDTDC